MTKELSAEIFEYFDKFSEKNKILVTQFLNRFPFHKSYLNRDVLDFGSGTGCLTFELAGQCGSVTGLEVDPLLYKYSIFRLSKLSQEKANKVNFVHQYIEELESSSYDVIFSKDVFEHVQNTNSLMKEIYRVLKPGGECMIGFGPLWSSPFGDHGIVKSSFGFTFPWFHLILGKENLVRAYNSSTLHPNKFSKKKIKDLSSYLNLKSGNYFRDLIMESDFEVIWYDENVHENFLVKRIKNFMIRNSSLSKYFIRNIYCILKKPIS